MWYPTEHMLGLPRNGVNHVGMEGSSFNQTTGPIRGTNYPVTSDKLLDWYAATGMRSVRLLFCWEAVQNNMIPLPPPPLGLIPIKDGSGYEDYWNDLAGVVNRLIDRGIYVILGAYQHNPASGDTDIVYRGQSFTPQHFADFWSKLATAINADITAPPLAADRVQRLGFDLINEPHEKNAFVPNDRGIPLANWKASAQAAIDAIRANPTNTNTIFVAGTGYASANGFVSNGSAAMWATLIDPLGNIAVTAHCYDGTTVLPGETPSNKPVNVLRTACGALVSWARGAKAKVNIGEIAVDAGVNGCGSQTLATNQWNDWRAFCVENDDVLIGWNWWANTQTPPWGWSIDGSCNGSRHWGLAQNGGDSPSAYAALIKGSLPVPDLYLRDNPGDTGTEPNVTATIAYESPDIWARLAADGVPDDQQIVGGQLSFVYVRVTNRGQADYPGAGNNLVALYWAKASAGLGCPEPWNGKVNGVSDPKQGGMIGTAAIPAIPAGQSAAIFIAWAATPNPQDYPGGDGHFCLLAVITKAKPDAALRAFDHEGFEPQLGASVVKLNNVAWHNIHIAAGAIKIPGTVKLGELVLANPTSQTMRAQLAFELLDADARPLAPGRGQLLFSPEAAAAEMLRAHAFGAIPPQETEPGTFALGGREPALFPLDLPPGQRISIGLSYRADRPEPGLAVRAVQYALRGDGRSIVGGQTFVVGAVAGFTGRPSASVRDRRWWFLASVAGLLVLLLLILLAMAPQ